MTTRIILNILILLCFVSSPSWAGDNNWRFEAFCGTCKWTEYKNHQAYIENPKHAQNSQWYGKEWFAEDWLAQYENDQTLIKGFYKADIIREQKVDGDGIPVLVVGPNFYQLSGYDKRRVTHVIDVVYNITTGTEVKAYELRDWFTKRQIGLYTVNGLQIL